LSPGFFRLWRAEGKSIGAMSISREKAIPTSRKPVLKRPWRHHVIIVCYVVAPFANVLLLMAFLHVPLTVIVGNLVAGYGLLATIWLLSAPIAGILLYFVRRFSWYVFLGHSSLIFLDFVIKCATRPLYYLHTIPGFHNVILVAGNLALVAAVTYIIQRDFRAPYFQVLNRSWREHVRIPIYHSVLIDGQFRLMNDLSTGGCFVLESGLDRKPGSKVTLSFRSNTLNIESRGEIMRVTGSGFGIRFIRLPAVKRRDIRRMLKVRFALRQKVDIPCTWIFQDDKSQSKMIDLSSGGCYLQTQLSGLSEGAGGELKVTLPCNKRSYSLPGQVAWVNRFGTHEKPVGFGFKFSRRQAGFMKDVTLHYGQGMLVR
jgi:Tfp pilus assembly protein PilZ